MKKTLLIAILALFSTVCVAQGGGPLKFLGIPIDGTEAQFVSKLKAKGFTYSALTEGYKGQFNGKSVDVYIHTNHNLVDRVYVAFPYTNEDGIKSEFNRLLGQFKDNAKYMALVMNEEIPEDDRFVATCMDGMRSLADGDVWFMIHERYGRYQIGLYYDNLHNQAHGEDL